MVCNVPAGEINVAGKHPAEFVDPGRAGGAVAADERVHRQHVHRIIMRLGGFCRDTVAQVRVVNDVVAADKPGQVEGFAGRIERHRALARVGADALGGNMLIPVEDQVGPDFVRNDKAVVGFVDLHRLLDLPALPHAAGRVVRAAEDRHMDVVLLQLAVHILKVHAPDALLVKIQRRMNDLVTVVGDAAGKADIGRAVQQHAVAGGRKGGQRADHTAKHAVFIADMFGQHALDIVALLLPADDGVVIFRRGAEIAVGRVGGTADDRFRDGGRRGEVHIGHPHRDHIKAGFGRRRGKPLAETVHRNSVHPMAVHDRGKIKLHR